MVAEFDWISQLTAIEDGSDFQGQTSLLILSKLMETIAGERKKSQERTAKREHLRPCDVFDMIGGVGIGGFVAAVLHPVQFLIVLIDI